MDVDREFLNWLISYAEDITLSIYDELFINKYLECQLESKIFPTIYPFILHRAWDGFNRKTLTSLSKDRHAVSQKSWYGIRKEYNDFKYIESTLTIQEQAMEFLLKEMWKIKEEH